MASATYKSARCQDKALPKYAAHTLLWEEQGKPGEPD